jgi:hypothetical protein
VRIGSDGRGCGRGAGGRLVMRSWGKARIGRWVEGPRRRRMKEGNEEARVEVNVA